MANRNFSTMGGSLSQLATLKPADIQVSQMGAHARKETMNPDANYGLGIAKVINIDYVEFYVTLRTLGGTSQQFDRTPIPLTFPGAGNRHFFGAMPCVGDYCIVGWLPHTASSARGGGTKTPVILAWMIPGTISGMGWLTTSEFERDEFDQAVPANQQFTEASHNFVRHKLRHIQSGNIVGSSSQGSDLVLDESVTLANRRGNEFRLRDQDQAAITRALQEFHALAGARVYAGMVQRDASLLPTTMISDGKQWDNSLQAPNGLPATTNPDDPANPKGHLTPARIFGKSIPDDTSNGPLGRSLFTVSPYLDPYRFLRSGGYINEAGYAQGNYKPDAVYGGKPIYRVARESTENATIDPDAQTLTEYRLEVTHTSDGRLPVTEQTDMFDAERLPGQDPGTSTGGALPSGVPFIEWVLGSVVGNDPYSEDGRRKYGMPLKATIFDGSNINPRLDPVVVSGSSPTPLKDHLATLFRFRPPLEKGGPETFWGVDKQGRFKGSIGGDPKDNSVEMALAGGLKLAVGGHFEWLGDGHFGIGTKGANSIGLRAESGPVTIYGGGGLKDASTVVSNLSGTGRGADDLPSVDIQGKTNVRMQAQKQLVLKGSEITADASTIDLTGQDVVSINGVKQVGVITENFQVSVRGKCPESVAGPKYLLPTSGPLHERTYTPAFPGLVCERVSYTWGDREEKFNLGNHKTEILIGNMLYSTKLGSWTAQAVNNSLAVNPTGVKAVATLGTVSISAVAGSVSISGSTGVTISATAGSAVVHGSAGVSLSAPVSGTEFGPIITAGSRDPLTNLPFATFGMGAPGHRVVV